MIVTSNQDKAFPCRHLSVRYFKLEVAQQWEIHGSILLDIQIGDHTKRILAQGGEQISLGRALDREYKPARLPVTDSEATGHAPTGRESE